MPYKQVYANYSMVSVYITQQGSKLQPFSTKNALEVALKGGKSWFKEQ